MRIGEIFEMMKKRGYYIEKEVEEHKFIMRYCYGWFKPALSCETCDKTLDIFDNDIELEKALEIAEQKIREHLSEWDNIRRILELKGWKIVGDP